jgi:signal transduction histidine kinase
LDTPPHITIHSSLLQNKCIIQFEDNGLGIDLNKNRDKIFHLYQRFHEHRTGKGLGLYLVKTQMESMRGNILVESTPNVGSKFILEIPIL